jgi:adenylosuccinate synthase
VNGISSLVVTKLDVLDAQREIQVCTNYLYKGSPVREMPASAEDMEKITPEYKTLPGWESSTAGISTPDRLPQKAKDYLRFMADQLCVEIGMVSTGPERDAAFIVPGSKFSSWL